MPRSKHQVFVNRAAMIDYIKLFLFYCSETFQLSILPLLILLGRNDSI